MSTISTKTRDRLKQMRGVKDGKRDEKEETERTLSFVTHSSTPSGLFEQLLGEPHSQPHHVGHEADDYELGQDQSVKSSSD